MIQISHFIQYIITLTVCIDVKTDQNMSATGVENQSECHFGYSFSLSLSFSFSCVFRCMLVFCTWCILQQPPQRRKRKTEPELTHARAVHTCTQSVSSQSRPQVIVQGSALTELEQRSQQRQKTGTQHSVTFYHFIFPEETSFMFMYSKCFM